MDDAMIAAADRSSIFLSNPLILPLVPEEQRAGVRLIERLNQHLTAQAHGRGEPVLRQIRLNWWANELTALTPACTRPDPLLTEVAANLLDAIPPEAFGQLAQAWAMSVDADEPELIAVRGRALFALWGHALGAGAIPVDAAGAAWALTEEALTRMPDQPATELWRAAQNASADVRVADLPRPLAALAGLVRQRAKHSGAYRAISEQGVILRIGLLGR